MKLIKLIIAFIIFNLIISIFTMPMLLSLNYFKPLKDSAIQTIIETRRGPRILALFMSQETMDKYKKDSMPEDSDQKNTKKLKIDTTKHDPSIEVKKAETDRFTYYVMLIKDPTRVKVVASKNIPESGERVSDMAKRANAIGAINGGGFIDQGWQGNGGLPIGVTISNGKDVTTNSAAAPYVIGLDKNGVLMAGSYSTNDCKRLNITNALSFPGPVLIRNGKSLGATGGGWNPRTAIGQTQDGYIIFLVVDGRSYKSTGATYKDLTDIMIKNGAVTAVNLDGGSSTTMYYEGEVINSPGNLMGERYVPTAFVVTQ